MDEDVPNNLLEEETLTDITGHANNICGKFSVYDRRGGNSDNTSRYEHFRDGWCIRLSLQRTEDMDVDTQPMRGPREQGNTTSDILDHFIDDNDGDVLRSSLLNPSSHMSLLSVQTSPPQSQPRTMALDWYVPDRMNRRVIEIPKGR